MIRLPPPPFPLRFYPHYSVGKAERCREADVVVLPLEGRKFRFQSRVTRASSSSFSWEVRAASSSIRFVHRSPDCYNRKLQQPGSRQIQNLSQHGHRRNEPWRMPSLTYSDRSKKSPSIRNPAIPSIKHGSRARSTRFESRGKEFFEFNISWDRISKRESIYWINFNITLLKVDWKII